MTMPRAGGVRGWSRSYKGIATDTGAAAPVGAASAATGNHRPSMTVPRAAGVRGWSRSYKGIATDTGAVAPCGSGFSRDRESSASDDNAASRWCSRLMAQGHPEPLLQGHCHRYRRR